MVNFATEDRQYQLIQSVAPMNTPILLSKFLLIFSVSLLITSAQAESKRSPHYEKCMDEVDHGAFKKSQWAACAAQEIKRQDESLNAEYSKLRKTLSSDQMNSLVKAQRSWLKFREDWCRFEEVGPSAPGGEVNYQFCFIEITDKQIYAIKSLQF